MSQPETTTNPLSTSWETIPTGSEHPIRTSSLPAATTCTEPETAIMEVTVNAASPPAIISPEGPYDLIASASQAARNGQLHVGLCSPLPEDSPAQNPSVPRHTVATIWPEPEAVSSAEANKDEGCGLKHWLWACVVGLNYICCMT